MTTAAGEIAAPTAGVSMLLRLMPAVFVVIWSTGFIVARYAMPHAPPLGFLAVRFALSAACFLPWVWLARVAWPVGRVQWLHLGVAGALMNVGYLGGVWVAVKAGMGSGMVALLVGLQPVLTAIWMSRGGAGVSARQWAGLCLGLGGLVLVVSAKLGHGEASLFNLACAGLALLSITAGTLYQKRHVGPCDVRSAVVVQQLAALVIALPLALVEWAVLGDPGPAVWSAPVLWAMAWAVLVLTLGGSSLLYLLLSRGGATQVTSLLYLVPPTTALMAWALFGEALTPSTLLGTVLTALGVALVLKTATAATTKETST